MTKRRYHTKVKTGCLNCKRRHIKCDQGGPPCANCVKRFDQCSQAALPVSLSTDGDTGTSVASASPPASTPPPSPNNAVEMTLMHRWTTNTYISLCCISEEHLLMQFLVPKLALEHPFLMDGILACAALELAATGQGYNYPPLPASTGGYARIAAQYYGRGISAYRATLLNSSTRETMNPQLHQALLIFSCLALVFNIAMPQHVPGSGSALESTLSHFGMMQGAAHIAEIGLDWLEGSGFPTNARPNWETDVPLDQLDDDTKAAVARLHRVNSVISAESLDPEELVTYTRAITLLEEHFARNLDRNTKGLSILWPTMVGKNFAAAVQQGSPLALLLLMHWGVILHRQAVDYWWADPAGKSLVREIAEGLSTSSFATVTEWNESISWALLQVEDR